MNVLSNEALRTGNYYMVNDALWQKYGVGRVDLCKHDFEKRIGRKLRPSDYTSALINNSEFIAMLLTDDK